MSVLLLIAATCLGFIAWFISTLSAGGAVTLLMPILAFTLSAELIAPTVTIAALIANPTRVISFWRWVYWPIAWRLILGSCIGAWLGTQFFISSSDTWLLIFIGVFLLSTPLQYRLGKLRRSFNMPVSGFVPLGIIVAFVSALVGGSGPVYNPFLLNAGLEKETLIATKAINSLVMQAVKLFGYGFVGALSLDSAMLGVAIGLGGALSIGVAKRYLAQIAHLRFQQYTLLLMFIAGLLLTVKGVHAI